MSRRRISGRRLSHSEKREVRVGWGGGDNPLQEANGDVPLDGVAFSQLDWQEWGHKFSDFWGK